MDHCLKIIEIQTLIIEHLEEACSSTTDPSRDDYFATQASLARTSSIFTEAALDALWHEQPSLAYLIQVMPDNLWTITIEPEPPSGTDGITRTVETLKFNRPLEDTDWSRLEYYSHRIRSLGNKYRFLSRPPDVDEFGVESFNSAHRLPPNVDASAFESFSSHRPFQSLLPNLCTFDLDLADPSTLRCLPFIPAVLLSNCPKLWALRFIIPDKLPDEFPLFLSSISSTCRNIEDLEVRRVAGSRSALYAPMLSTPHSIMLIQFICGLNDLQSLTIPGEWTVTPDLIHHLGSLTGLYRCEDIFIDCSVAPHQIRQLFKSDRGRFRKLRYLNLRTSTAQQAADIMQSLQLPLEHLSVDSRSLVSQPFSSVQSLMESFVNHNCISSLTSLNLCVSSANMHGTSPDSPCNNFKPLFLLKALRTLYLEWENISPFDDKWLAEAAMAWPHLSRLILGSLDHNSPPVATLAGVVPLIRHCPQLSYLSLTLHAKPFGRDQDVLLPGVCNRRITSLSMPFSRITDPEGVCRCMQLMFPCLTSIYYGPNIYENRDQVGDWDRLVELLGLER
ncbi:hypothetical protein FPV67DRAFT_333419 [Lyophyllum atratum]|nr:hypothetical protein FPV67DRAFT_333419 [Lyophyllum atratum]